MIPVITIGSDGIGTAKLHVLNHTDRIGLGEGDADEKADKKQCEWAAHG